MLDAFGPVTRWLQHTSDVLAPPSPYVQQAMRQIEYEHEASSQHWIDWDVSELDRFLQIVDQQRLEFAEEDSHANVRQAVARYLEQHVTPITDDERLQGMPSRLRGARLSGTIMYRREDQKLITIWDTKAGVPLLCPDDAREEGMRVARRYVPTITDWRNNGKAVHKLVLSPPNVPRGELKQAMRDLFKTFNKIFFKSGKFPQIKGALVTLEAPLAKRRDWNVHLNVILLCDGFLDYQRIVEHWGHQFDAQRLRGSREQIEAALRECVKYATQAMPSKTAEHRARGVSEAPALIEWTGDEFLEWWRAHQRFRRTRSYGVLFGLDDPEPESLDGFEAVGTVSLEGTQRVRRFALLDSIPGDKSSGEDHRQRLSRAVRRLLGSPGGINRALQTMKEASEAWQEIRNRTH